MALKIMAILMVVAALVAAGSMALSAGSKTASGYQAAQAKALQAIE